MHLLCVQKVRQVKQLFDAKELVGKRGRGGGKDARVKRGSRREQIAKELRVLGVLKKEQEWWTVVQFANHLKKKTLIAKRIILKVCRWVPDST